MRVKTTEPDGYDCMDAGARATHGAVAESAVKPIIENLFPPQIIFQVHHDTPSIKALFALMVESDRSRHPGMDCRDPCHKDALKLCHPWLLGPGNPCRGDANDKREPSIPNSPNKKSMTARCGFSKSFRLN